jgi:hypothetical protein
MPATTSRPTQPELIESAHGRCNLIVEIARDRHEEPTQYILRPADTPPGVIGAVWLTKRHDGPPTVYLVRRYRDGRIDCDCADAIYRRCDTPTLCKHGAALRALGIL